MTRSGIDAQARMVLLGRRRGGPAGSMVATRAASAVSTVSASSRATCWPTHWCRPIPNPTCPDGSRPRSKVPASGPQNRGSRLADPRNISTLRPAGTPTPAISVSVAVVRKKVCTGDSQRTASSNATRASPGSARSRAHCSGCVATACSTAASPVTVVSTPADSSDRTTSGACSGVRSPRSAAAQMSAPKPSAASASLAHCAFTQAESSPSRGSFSSSSALRGPNALNSRSP